MVRKNFVKNNYNKFTNIREVASVKSNCNESCNKSKCLLRVVHQNMQCIKNKLQALEIFLNDCKPNIFAVTEHWLDDAEISGFGSFCGYTLVSFFTRKMLEGGGVAIFVKEATCYRTLEWVSDCSIEKVIEICGVTIKGFVDNIIILAVYRPPSGDLNIFFNLLNRVLDKLINLSIKICILGDFNLDVSRSTNNVKILLDLMRTFNFNHMVSSLHL